MTNFKQAKQSVSVCPHLSPFRTSLPEEAFEYYICFFYLFIIYVLLLYTYLSVYLFTDLFIYLFIYLFIHLYTFIQCLFITFSFSLNKEVVVAQLQGSHCHSLNGRLKNQNRRVVLVFIDRCKVRPSKKRCSEKKKKKNPTKNSFIVLFILFLLLFVLFSQISRSWAAPRQPLKPLE